NPATERSSRNAGPARRSSRGFSGNGRDATAGSRATRRTISACPPPPRKARKPSTRSGTAFRRRGPGTSSSTRPAARSGLRVRWPFQVDPGGGQVVRVVELLGRGLHPHDERVGAAREASARDLDFPDELARLARLQGRKGLGRAELGELRIDREIGAV